MSSSHGSRCELEGAASTTGFGDRDAEFTFNISSITDTAAGFDPELEWVRDYWKALLPHQSSVYVNFLMDADTDRIRDAYGADRFSALKTAYDPDNVFHLNQNVAPTPAG